MRVLSEPRSRDRLLPAGAAVVIFGLGAISACLVMSVLVALLNTDPLALLQRVLP